MANAALNSPRSADLDEADFFFRTRARADLLRARRFDEPDPERPIDDAPTDGFLPKAPDLIEQS